MEGVGHKIEISPEREFMQLTLWGHWNDSATDGLAVNYAKAVRAMTEAGARHGHVLTLVDMREKRLSEEFAVMEFRKFFECNSPSRRTAILISWNLPITMASKIASRHRVRAFYSKPEALNWLWSDSRAIDEWMVI